MTARKASREERRFQPAQLLAASFVCAIFIGTLLLMLPFSTHSGQISFVDALFTATSAVCVTGLTVQDTSAYFTTAGQIILLTLFQLGGLGIMAFSSLILLVAGRRISIQDRIIIQEGYASSKIKNVKGLLRNIFIYALILELAGALFLFVHWRSRFSGARTFLESAFHSVSAFCNAGFSLSSDSFVADRGDVWLNVILMVLIVLGGLGFFVLQELKEIGITLIKRKKVRVSLHTKLVLTLTFFLIVGSALTIFILEGNRAMSGFELKEKILASVFQAVTARTAGFNTMALNSLSVASVFMLIILMFIGASPGSTGGGVKTSTAGVIFAFLRSRVSARESVSLFYRTLPFDLVIKAFAVVTLSIGVIFLAAFILFIVQQDGSMKGIFFEVVSAFGTVGLSLGITQGLTGLGKSVLLLTMYIGRIGPLTLLYAFSRRRAYGKYEYVEESVMIG
ncbi:MAG: TrkH family potassium uptake protein [Candidatus Aminicenantes bacterium]|jgi:trk system potassium uptake protein TrkH